MSDEIVVLDERVELTLGQLCELAGVHAETAIALVEEGLIDPLGDLAGGPAQWRFSGPTLGRLQGILRLQRDLALDPCGAAMVLDLMDEVEHLRARLRALEALLQE